MSIITWLCLLPIIIYLVYGVIEFIRNEPRLNWKNIMTCVYKKNEANNKFIKVLEKIPKFRPNPLLPGAYLKLLLVFRSKPTIESLFDRTVFEFKDGGKVALDFYPKKEVLEKRGYQKQSPIIIVVPGLSGSSNERYLIDTCNELYETCGYRSLVANRRGYAGVPISGKYPGFWIRYEDTDDIVEYLKQREDTKNSPIYLLGLSLGANFVHWYCGRKGELGHKMPIKGGIAVSGVFDMDKSSNRIEENFFIARALSGGLKKTFDEHFSNKIFSDYAKSVGITREMIANVGGLREFDDKITSKWYGRKGCEDYYQYFSGNRRLQHVSVPLLNISSLSDPVIANENQDHKKILENGNIFQLNVRDGGHVTYPHGLRNKNYASVYASKWIQSIESLN